MKVMTLQNHYSMNIIKYKVNVYTLLKDILQGTKKRLLIAILG